MGWLLLMAVWLTIPLPLTLLYAATQGVPVAIVLREFVELPARKVMLADIADIHGGPEPLRQQMARLELEDVVQVGQMIQITSRRVAYRLRLAGIDPDAVRIQGAQLVRVRFGDPPPLASSALEGSPALAPEIRPREVRPHTNVQADYRIPRMNYLNAVSAEPGNLAQENLTPRAGRREPPAMTDQAVVRKGEFLRLIALVGPLEISTRGEALADGKLGQVIPVRNVDSKQIVQARIIRPATARVDY